jgi:hypothetical protein
VLGDSLEVSDRGLKRLGGKERGEEREGEFWRKGNEWVEESASYARSQRAVPYPPPLFSPEQASKQARLETTAYLGLLLVAGEDDDAAPVGLEALHVGLRARAGREEDSCNTSGLKYLSCWKEPILLSGSWQAHWSVQAALLCPARTCRPSSERFLRRWSTAMPMEGANLAGMPASCE